MARDGGRIVILSDFGPERLLRMAEHLARDADCGIEDLPDDSREGFHIYNQITTDQRFDIFGNRHTLGFSAPPPPRLDIEVYVDRTKKGDGRITLDWWVVEACQSFVQTFANKIEDRIEKHGGKVLESYDD